jgi:hypothetical protein
VSAFTAAAAVQIFLLIPGGQSCSSEVKLLITTNLFFIEQRATAQSKTGIFRDYGVAEAPPVFQASWSGSRALLKYHTMNFIFHHSINSDTHENMPIAVLNAEFYRRVFWISPSFWSQVRYPKNLSFLDIAEFLEPSPISKKL